MIRGRSAIAATVLLLIALIEFTGAFSTSFTSFARGRRGVFRIYSETAPPVTPAVASVPPFCKIAFISEEKGRGVVATESIKANTVIGDYEGETITESVKDRRYLKSREAERDEEDHRWLASRVERGQSASGDYLFGVSGVDAFIDAEDGEYSL